MPRCHFGLVLCLMVVTQPVALIASNKPVLAIVPRPIQCEARPGEFRITAASQILVEAGVPGFRQVGEHLAEVLRNGTGYNLSVTTTDKAIPPDGAILLTTSGAQSSWDREGYRLLVEQRKILLQARESAGLFYGVQTLRQLGQWEFSEVAQQGGSQAGSRAIPCALILDGPRYRWRGMLLDCCRHFMSKEFVKRYIDLLAYHKMNVLHWHLTEDQGWRIEIKKHPRLTEVGAWRRAGADSYGGYYSQEDIKEIVAYAAANHVTVVPEIEMPGHALAALASYPGLSCTGGPFEVGTRWGVYTDVYCAGEERTFEFLEDVLTEVVELFPSSYIHVGGDECPKERWKACTKCQSRIRAEGLVDEDELQSYFIRRIEKFLTMKNRRLIGWDEILEGGLAPSATVQSWRGLKGAIISARAGHDVICSPTSHCYLDYAQFQDPSEPLQMGFIDLETVYSFEPTPPELTAEEARRVLGAEGNIWTEHAPQDRVDHQVFPRLCALAEVSWSADHVRDWGEFQERMKTHYGRLDALGVTYFIEPPKLKTRDTVFETKLEIQLSQAFADGEIFYTLDDSEPSQHSQRYDRPLRITASTVLRARTILPNGRSSLPCTFRFFQQEPREAVEPPAVVPGVDYAYYEGSWDRLPDFGKLTPIASGYHTEPDLALRRRDDGFALRFSGFISVPNSGVYTFYLSSDNRSKLWIADQVVVDTDSLPSSGKRSGQINLRAGKHPLTIVVFQSGGLSRLALRFRGPALEEQRVPASVLWRPVPSP